MRALTSPVQVTWPVFGSHVPLLASGLTGMFSFSVTLSSVPNEMIWAGAARVTRPERRSWAEGSSFGCPSGPGLARLRHSALALVKWSVWA